MLKRLYKVGRPRQLGDIWGEMWRWNGMWVTGLHKLKPNPSELNLTRRYIWRTLDGLLLMQRKQIEM